MASAFDGMGLGMMGSEKGYMGGGKSGDDVRFLLGSLLKMGLDGSKPETVHQIASRYKVTATTMNDRIEGIMETIRTRYNIEDLT